MSTLSERTSYRPDMRISWERLPILLTGAFAAALAIGWGLQFLFMHEHYWIFFAPAFAGLLLGGVLHLLVGWAHCRNSWLAGAIGLAAGVLAYAGYFYFCLMHQVGGAPSPAVLPDYIQGRLASDVEVDVGAPLVGLPAKRPSYGMNCVRFGMELVLLMSFASVPAWIRARRCYVAELGRWMDREYAQFPPYRGEALKQAIETETLADFLVRIPPGGDARTACRLCLEYARTEDGTTLSYPVYASIEDQPARRPWYWPRHLRKTCLRQTALSVGEVLTLLPVFPKLTSLLVTEHPELLNAPLTTLAASAPLSGHRETSALAVIAPVPEPWRQQVRAAGYTLWVNLIGLIPGVFFFGGIGLLALGGYGASKDATAWNMAAIIVGALATVWGGYTGLYCLGVYENRWIERRLRGVIARRPGPWVDPNAADARYVSIIPRENWTRVRMTMSSDLLLWRIDGPERTVVMEGDCDRYRIPGGAIAICEPQCFFHPLDAQHQNELWMVRLMVRVEDGMRELLLSPGHTTWRPLGNAGRRRQAETICAQFNALGETAETA